MEIKNSKPVSTYEVKELLTTRKKEAELAYEQNQALDHAERFSAINTPKAASIVKELTKGGKITEEAVIKLVDVKPTKPETVRAILLKDRIELSDEEIEKVLKLLNE